VEFTMSLMLPLLPSVPLIRPARAGDVPAMLAVSNWAALHTAANFAVEPEPLDMWQQLFHSTKQRYPWLVAEGQDGGPVLGFAKAGPHKSRCAYGWTAELSVYVDPSAHGQGIGTALYGCLIPVLRQQGFLTLLAGITSPNPASERLHGVFGFSRCATFHRAGYKFGRFHDVGYWELHLSTWEGPPGELMDSAQAFRHHARGCSTLHGVS
jgi:phosphinothricin acetyltransferase